MGNTSNFVNDTQSIIEFREPDEENSGCEKVFEMPEKAENRKPTDQKWIIIFLLTALVFIPLHIYNLTRSDIYRLCKKLSCDLYINVSDIQWVQIFLVAFITIVFNTVALLLFRYATEVIVWGVLVLSLIIVGALTGMSWIWYYQTTADEDFHSSILFLAVISSLFLVTFVVLLLSFFKKVDLIVLLYHETTRCVFDMPLITIIPIICSFILLAIWIVFYNAVTWMSTVGEVRRYHEEIYYEMDLLTKLLVFSLALLTIWSTFIIVDFQYLTIAGCVTTWYFARRKSAPIKTGLWQTVRYHLGSVVLGSLVITIIAIVKALLQSIAKTDCKMTCVKRWLSNFEESVMFLSENAYIEMAIHGQSFFKSGRRAVKLMSISLNNVLAINSVGELILSLCVFFIFGLSLTISIEIFRVEVQLVINELLLSVIVSLFIILGFFGVFKVIVDSLYICYCEDIALNNGDTKPYVMSNDLMKFFDETKKFYQDKTYRST